MDRSEIQVTPFRSTQDTEVWETLFKKSPIKEHADWMRETIASQQMSREFKMFLLGITERVEPDALTVALYNVFDARTRNGDTAWDHIRMILISALLTLDESALHIELPMDVPSVDAMHVRIFRL